MDINETVRYAACIAGGWAVVNGILHDIFVLAQKRKYDRDLLRLLMDGHILMTCGAMQLIASGGLAEKAIWALEVGAIATISLLIYTAFIFPFLKSIGTILINLSLFILLIISFFS